MLRDGYPGDGVAGSEGGCMLLVSGDITNV